MPEEGMQPGAGGNIFTNRILGIPGVVWLIGAGVLAYFIFFRNKGQSAGSPSTSGGGGTITQGNTTIDKGAVTVTVTQNPGANKQPGPNPPPRQHHGKSVKVPEVAGQRAAFAISMIESNGLEVITSPFRDSKKEYVATGTVPPGGTTVPEGTKVKINVRALPKSQQSKSPPTKKAA